MKKFVKLLTLTLAVALCVVLLAACAPNSDPDKAKASLEENGYTAVKVNPNVSIGIIDINTNKDIDCIVSGTKVVDDKVEHVAIYYFVSASAANDAWEDMQEEADKAKDDEDTDWVCKKSGKMIYYGTEAAVKAAQ